ncbi:hypothetical protein SAMN05216429_10657 [Marinobacter persicus]|uniref:Toxin CptA n=1 Tax=Marinobacter persicus TaxID=930118 RepID=A0A1I3UFI5_9GAMM|nr:hypothetical protein [Marinobacter persicus]SFJ80636.1 hypothetical protein SAMN05216429_10657 [Marinobacter persicus]
MSSQLELALTPSATAGLLGALPWALLAMFAMTAGLSAASALLWALPVLAWGGWQAYRRHGLLQGPRSVTALKTDNRGLHCVLADGTELPVAVDSASSLGPSLMALKFRVPGTTFGKLSTLIISKPGMLPANAPANDCRRLRMWLRAGQHRNPR